MCYAIRMRKSVKYNSVENKLEFDVRLVRGNMGGAQHEAGNIKSGGTLLIFSGFNKGIAISTVSRKQ